VGRACSTHGREKEFMQGFDGKAEGKRPLGRPRRRWEDKIEMNLREIGWGCMDWISLVWKNPEYLRDWWLLKKNSSPRTLLVLEACIKSCRQSFILVLLVTLFLTLHDGQARHQIYMKQECI
jgi:hypothetical protein